ncbi:MAG: GDCCVxC domain-containing (seleno)protein [Burkholderiales bacterium]
MEYGKVVLESDLTCPHCGFAKTEIMPVDACLYFYECTNCRAMLKPTAGDCCVFCSYGTVKCPPIQMHRCC